MPETARPRFFKDIGVSARSALKSAWRLWLGLIPIFVLALFLDRLGEGKPFIVILIAYTFLCIAWFGYAFISTFIDLRKDERLVISPSPSFGASTFASLGTGMMIAIFAPLLIWLHGDVPLLEELLLWVVLGACVLGLPRRIHCTENSVWQRNRWGRKKEIPYSAIKDIFADNDGVTVVDDTEVPIVHGQYHVGREIFVRLLCERTGIRVIDPHAVRQIERG